MGVTAAHVSSNGYQHCTQPMYSANCAEYIGAVSLLEATLAEELHRVVPGAVPVRLACKPVIGAVIDALELAGADTGEQVRERLVASFQGVLS